MLVSEFEIRRHDHERQHYWLSVTNLEDKDYEYSIEFHGEQSSGASHTFASLARVSFTVDEPLSEDTIVFLRNPHVYGPGGSLRRFVIPAQRTALLELYPPGPNRGEGRGYVVLRLPTKYAASAGVLRQEPQSDNPVRVLVNAESHITRVPESFYAGNTGVVLAHSDGMTHPYSFSISLASGKAENLLDPDGTFRIRISSMSQFET